MPRLSFCLLIFVGLVCVQSPAQAPSAQAAKPAITLEDALKLAQNNEPTFAAAVAESRATALQRADARAALLPSVALHNQYLYTQSNRSKAATTQGTVSDSLPIFIANNAVHEYISQGTVNETVGLGAVAAARLAGANAARAQAELEISRRGLVAAVVQLFYSVRSGGEKLAVAQRALAEANHFVDITQKRETAGESAHADVIKARLGQQQRERELGDAILAQEKAKLELGVLLYADPRVDFTVAEDAEAPILPDRKDVETAAGSNSPEVRSALASLKAGQAETLNSLGGLLPDLSLNYTYGIDAPQLSSYGPGGVRNLGYSASATVDLPIWDWLTSERKIKEARLRADAGKVALTSAQRHLLADIEEFYHEAETAQQQMASLEASVTDAREAMRLTNLRYVNGESTVLDVVDAQNTLVTSENARADGVVRYRLALAQLETLTGRL